MLMRSLYSPRRICAIGALSLPLLLFGCRKSSIEWTRHYFGDDFVANNLGIITTDSNTFLIACTKGPGNNACFLELSEAGDSLWSAEVAGSGFFSLRKLIEGGFIATGWKKTENGEAAVLTTGKNHEEIHSRKYGSSDSRTFTDVQAIADGGVIACGRTKQNRQDKWSDLFIVKTNSAGDTLWTREIETPGSQGIYQVVPMPDSGFTVVWSAYMVETEPPHKIKIRLLRLDRDGNKLWERVYGPDMSVEYPRIIAQGSELIICVNQQTSPQKDSTVNYRTYLVKVNAQGDTLWTRSFGNEKQKSLTVGDVLPVSYGYVIAGTDAAVLGYPFLMGINLHGDSLWFKRYKGEAKSGDFPSVVSTNDGAFVFAADEMKYNKTKREYEPRGLLVMKMKPVPIK